MIPDSEIFSLTSGDGELPIKRLIIDILYGTRNIPEEERRMLERGKLTVSPENRIGIHISTTHLKVYPRSDSGNAYVRNHLSEFPELYHKIIGQPSRR